MLDLPEARVDEVSVLFRELLKIRNSLKKVQLNQEACRCPIVILNVKLKNYTLKLQICCTDFATQVQ